MSEKMNRLQIFQVFPNIPEPLSFLEVLSRNLWWSWQVDATELFRRIDPRIWDDCGRNPIVFLARIPQSRLEALARDNGFLSDQERIKERFIELVCTPAEQSYPLYGQQGGVAYFSMEFGVHECLPLFAGGLGILAGDHLKAASDLAIPLTGVGLFYWKGYFHQFLDSDGWQQEENPEIDLYNLPVERAKDSSGRDVSVSVEGIDGEIHANVLKIMVGRTSLYLLDTNLRENPPEVREITSRLYAGDPKIRLSQELLLGIGGMRALAALEITPSVCHINEGHAAFAALEKLVQTISDYNVDLETALEIAPRTTVFTTHTPVAAGHDEYPADLIRPFLRRLEKKVGAKEDEILSWGQPAGSDRGGKFSMFVFGLRMAQHCNGVSKLHGKVARRMWSSIWPDRPEEEIPISHITNGIHIPTWVSDEISMLFERYLGPEWNLHPWNPDSIKRIDDIYDEELWRAHEMSRSRLVNVCRRVMMSQYSRRNAPKTMMEEAESVLDQDVLTIGFARRFTAYKRAYLLLMDQDRLESIISSQKYPVQFIFAGKAHPKDNEGKELIKRLITFVRKPQARHRIIFLEDYEIHLAQSLVRGVDVWLNTPRRPFEACGTSGMKAAVNGVLNVSIPDGWWYEAYSGKNGWQIGKGDEFADPGLQDAADSQALYNILENEVIPCFYDRKNGGLPDQWLKMMKESMKTVMLNFCSHEMTSEYVKQFYLPAAKQSKILLENNAERAKSLSLQHKRLRSLWNNIRIETPARDKTGPFRVGESFAVTSLVHLGDLLPDDVDVELYHGHLKFTETMDSSNLITMNVKEDRGDGKYLYGCSLTCRGSGRYGLTARVTPKGDEWIKNTPGLITWA